MKYSDCAFDNNTNYRVRGNEAIPVSAFRACQGLFCIFEAIDIVSVSY